MEALTILNKRRKKLIYRANHRGIKEMDLILGKFADAKLEYFEDAKLNEFELICNENDRDLLQWVMGEHPAPSHINDALIDEIKTFAAQSLT